MPALFLWVEGDPEEAQTKDDSAQQEAKIPDDGGDGRKFFALFVNDSEFESQSSGGRAQSDPEADIEYDRKQHIPSRIAHGVDAVLHRGDRITE